MWKPQVLHLKLHFSIKIQKIMGGVSLLLKWQLVGTKVNLITI